LALALVAGLGSLLRLSVLRTYDYDELSHAHMAWLVSVGEVPYRDFVANHFPFLWILLSPLMRILPESPTALTVLRSLALLLNLIFVGALGTLMCAGLPVRQRIWALVCFAMAVFSPVAMNFLIDFRPDPVANALLFSILAWVWLKKPQGFAAGLACGSCVGAALLINTKFVLFPFLLGAVAFAASIPHWRKVWPFALSALLGCSAAVACGAALLLWMNIPIQDAWRMVASYNSLVEKNRTYGFGLAQALGEHPLLLGFCVFGMVAYVSQLLSERRRPELLAIAIMIYLVIGLSATRPWRQYVVSWMFLAVFFATRSLSPLVDRLSVKAQVLVAFGFLGVVAIGAVRQGVDPYQVGITRGAQDRLIEWTTEHVPREGYVVAGFAMHPVFRRDTFFKMVYDATSSGDGIERYLPQLLPSSYRERFGQSGYEKQLETRPPSLTVFGPTFTKPQMRALDAFFSRQGDAYYQMNIPGTSIHGVAQTVEKRRSPAPKPAK
jgi:hypothetical protein